MSECVGCPVCKAGRAAAPSADVVALTKLVSHENQHDKTCSGDGANECSDRHRAWQMVADALSITPVPVQPDIVAALRELRSLVAQELDGKVMSSELWRAMKQANKALSAAAEPTVPLGGTQVPVWYVEAMRRWIAMEWSDSGAEIVTDLSHLITTARKEL